MKVQNYHALYKGPSSEKAQTRKEIIQMVKDACKKQHGMSDLGDGYVVVDTKQFEVKERD